MNKSVVKSSRLLKKSLLENFIFCAVMVTTPNKTLDCFCEGGLISFFFFFFFWQQNKVSPPYFASNIKQIRRIN